MREQSLKLNPVLVLVLKPKALYFFSRIKSRKAWRSSCPFWTVIKSVSIKKKENRNPGSNQTSNADLSYPNLYPLPLHYDNDPPKFRKI